MILVPVLIIAFFTKITCWIWQTKKHLSFCKGWTYQVDMKSPVTTLKMLKDVVD